MRTNGFIPTTIIVALLGSLPAGAQSGAPDTVAAELAGIGRTLDRLVRLMEAAEVRHEADLLLRRIDLAERRIAPLQDRLGDAGAEVHGLETEIRRMLSMVDELEQTIDDAIRDGTDRADSPERVMLSQIRGESKRLQEQLEVAELRKRQAEDALADAREAIELLDEALLELLESRR